MTAGGGGGGGPPPPPPPPPRATTTQVGVERPVRLRLLDLPFTAVDWVQPTEPQAVLPPVSLAQFTPGTGAAQDPGKPRQSGVPAAAAGQVSPSSPGGASQEGSPHPGGGGGEPSAVTARQAAIQAASSE
jgi:hypothetical protein